MKKGTGIFLIQIMVLIGLTYCEKPDHILLNAQSDVKFPDVDPMQENPEPTDPPDYLNPGLAYGTVTDIEGNTYRTIQIGTQTWMAENLRTTKFNDGSNVRNGLFGSDTKKTGSYWWYDNDLISYKNSYGALYNWYAVNTEKLCPSGWHVPGDEEWKQLELHLGMTLEEADILSNYYWSDEIIGRGTDQGNQLKSAILWMSSSAGNSDNGSNTTGFSAIPGGFIVFRKFNDSGSHAGWWSSTEYYDEWEIPGYSLSRELFSADPKVFRCINDQKSGLSVRCLKD